MHHLNFTHTLASHLSDTEDDGIELTYRGERGPSGGGGRMSQIIVIHCALITQLRFYLQGPVINDPLPLLDHPCR